MEDESTLIPSLELSRPTFARFAQFIGSELGIKMPEAKLSMLQTRLMRRLRELDIATLEEYQEFLFHSPQGEEERIHFINAVTTNKTDFFREPQHFEYLSRVAIPAIAHDLGERIPWRFKLWCAGCSSGEEPYTQAMVLSEYARAHKGFDYSILATDVSTKVLKKARMAIYDESRVAPVDIGLRQRYLLRGQEASRGVVRIVPELRQKVTFHRLNFMDGDYRVQDMFDAIFFRNVMIYFDRPTQEAVVNKLCANLRPGGYLFVGHSESLAGLCIPVNPIASAVFRKPLPPK